MPVSNTVNGVDLDRLSATIDAVVADPAMAHFEFRAENAWLDGGHSRSRVQGFFGVGREDATRAEPFDVDADEPPVLLGHNLAPNPGEYLLHALASCLTATVAYHAAARGIAIDGVACTVHGDIDLRGFLGLDGGIRPGFQRIRVTVAIAGDFDDGQFAELTSLAHFSPVRDSLTAGVPIDINVVRG